MSNSNIDPSWYRNLKGIGCGTTAGFVVTMAGHPFDTLKVRLQTQSSISPIYFGTADCIRKTIKWEGMRGLYKGVASPMAGQVLFRTSLFTTYYEALHYFAGQSPKNRLETKHYFLAGGITGFVAAFTDAPIELFKSKMQYQIIAEKKSIPLSIKYLSVWHCFRHTLSVYGIRGVFQGLGPTLARDIPGYFIYFGTNEYLKKLMAKEGEKVSDIGVLKTMFCAGMSGIAFWTTIYNIDVIKSAMMADDVDPKFRKYKNMRECAIKLYKNEGGYSRFWKGFNPCLMRAFLANALMLYVVDVTRALFPSYEQFSR